MQPAESLALRALGQKEDGPASELLVNDQSTGVVLPGVTLEAQYRFGDRYLLFTTENVPYEEALHILLLDQGFRRLDHIELSHPFAEGTLSDVRARDAQVQFSFFGGDFWELSVAPRPRHLARSECPVGVKGRLRRLLTPRFLVLRRIR